jgi:hypothetical protein
MFKVLSSILTFIFFCYFTVESIICRHAIMPVLRAIQRRRWVHEAQHGNWDLAMEMLRELNAELDADQRRSYR